MKKLINFLLVLVTLFSGFMLSASASDVLVRSDEGRLPFEDVRDSHWFAQSVEFCYVNDIIAGMNAYTFAPNSDLTRAQFVTMLAKVEGVDTSIYTETVFTDVKSNHWYYKAVSWAYDVGLVSGTAPDKFSPNSPVTRETISRIMWLFMKDKYPCEIPETVLDKYTDKNKISPWAEEGMKYLVGQGVISGMTENTLAPRSNLTRAQAARILSVFIKDYLYGECEHSFKAKNSCVDAPKCEKCGMTQSLATGHLLPEYSCTKGGICEICKAEVVPSDLVHRFSAATCLTAQTCSECGVLRGEPSGHSWIPATCNTPKLCKLCNETEGKALGHTTNNGICKNCGAEIFKSEAHRIGYYMVSKAIPDGKGHYTYDGLFEHKGGDTGYGKIYYDAHNFSYTLGYSYMWSSNRGYLDVAISVVPGTESYALNAEYYENNKLICSGTALIKPGSVKNGETSIKFTNYVGANGDKAWFEGVGSKTLENCVKAADYLLAELCNSGAGAFGFNNINY